MTELEGLIGGEFTWGDVKKNWRWHLLLGMFFVGAGTIGLLAIPLATLSTVLLFSVLMLLGGILQLTEAITAVKGWKSRAPHIIVSVFYIAAGLVSLLNPVAASLGLTIVLGTTIFAAGVFRVLIALQHKEDLKDWIMILASGLASIAIAVLIGFSWPYSALWSLGLFLSVDLISNGWSHVVIALAARKKALEMVEPDSGTEIKTAVVQ